MKNILVLLLVFTLCAVSNAHNESTTPSDFQITKEWIKDHYSKREVKITMRDGVKLFTSIYEPKDKSVKHPILMNRTCYSVSPYGEDNFMRLESLGWREYVRRGYILVFQDVRGKNCSEGKFEEIRHFVEGKKNPKYNKNGEVTNPDANQPIDEASDTYDTAEWLVRNTNSNGNIGIFGISYPGFYSTMAGMSGHPAVKAISPQAPVTDWFRGDDVHHNGAFFLADIFAFQYWFQYQNIPAYHNARFGASAPKLGKNPTDIVHTDLYNDFLKMGAVKNFSKLLGDSVIGWNEVIDHPDLDESWESRNVLYHTKNTKAPAVMVVGGLFDAEDCYGAFATYKQIKKDASKSDVYLVEGPWSHGAWSTNACPFFGNVYLGEEQAAQYFVNNIEVPFFEYYLKGKGEKPSAKARVYDSGKCSWDYYPEGWPYKTASKAYYLTEDGLLDGEVKKNLQPLQYISDPARPVPFTMQPVTHRPTTYMLEDQRFASARPDVLVFNGPVLVDSLQLAGEVEVDLNVDISGTDADFIVKIIDVFPDDFQYPDSLYSKNRMSSYNMSGYQMLVRGDVMRGKYRNSFSAPEPFVPGKPTRVKFRMPDVAHTFLPGHRMMIQVQSTWFPLVDRNPQKFCNIYECEDTDFQKATITIYPDSKILLPVVE